MFLSSPPKSIQEFLTHIEKLDISPLNKQILTSRYTQVLTNYSLRSKRYSIWFHTLRTIVTVGSLIVPALLSVQFSTTTPAYITDGIYWLTWTLSLLVTISNGVTTLYKVDKKYYMLHTIYEHLKSEGWQYLELSGKYSGHRTNGLPPTHENQFRYFTTSIEKIKMRQVEDEYFKVNNANEPHSKSSSSHNDASSAISSIVPPSSAELKDILTTMKGVLSNATNSQRFQSSRRRSQTYNQASAPLLPTPEETNEEAETNSPSYSPPSSPIAAKREEP